MLARLLNLLFLVLGSLIGYASSRGSFAKWLGDVGDALNMAWNHERVGRGGSGTIPVLIAGFLIGQGLFSLSKQLALRVRPWRLRRQEELAAWDSSLMLGTRFGLHQYLQRCSAWATGDPTARLQTLALFKIRGLGNLNANSGTLTTTQLLQRIAAEIRAASVPEGGSAIRRWLNHYFPRPRKATGSGLPSARYPARWSGATLALAFRELDALHAVSISRHVLAWIRSELSGLGVDTSISVVAVAVVGTAGVSPSALASVANNAIRSELTDALTVYVDSADIRGDGFAQVPGLNVVRIELPRIDRDSSQAIRVSSSRERVLQWIRTWGLGFAYFLCAWLILAVTGGQAVVTRTFPWPGKLDSIQVVDSAGPRTVRLVRQRLPAQSTQSWQVSDGVLVQGDARDGGYWAFQAHMKVKNSSSQISYLSPLDFTAVDVRGNTFALNPIRNISLTNGLAGRWLKPNETWEGWLTGPRGQLPISSLIFRPDDETHLRITAADGDASAP